jgi:hypothetical protein
MSNFYRGPSKDAYMPTIKRLKAVRALGFATHTPPPEILIFRRTQNGAFCCILDIKSLQSNCGRMIKAIE